MQANLLQRAREGRIAALESLAQYKEDNIFALDENRRTPNVVRVKFTSARSTVADRPAASDLRIAA